MTDPLYIKAKREVSVLKGFYIYALVFACVISGIIGLNIFLLPNSGWWVQWPMMGMSIGLFLHVLAVYMRFRLFDQDWDVRKIQERLERK